MPGPSKVIVVVADAAADARAGRQLQLGFEREGVPTRLVPASARLELPVDEAGLVVVGGHDGVALEVVRTARRVLDEKGVQVPLLFAGAGVQRPAAQAAGADEVVTHPAYLRDVVTIARILRGHPPSQRGR